MMIDNNRQCETMKRPVVSVVVFLALLETYGSAAREIIPDLKELIVHYKELLKEWQFPDTTISAVEHAIKVIEAAKDRN